MDSALNGRVTNTLLGKPHLGIGGDFSCETSGGCVVLKGTVPSFYQKQMAQESLRSVEGISEILNELEVLGRSIRLDGKESHFDG